MKRIIVSSSPHIRTKNETPRVMLDVVISLLPAALAGVLIFGLKALLVIVTCVISSIVSEYVFNIVTKKQQTIYDMSAVVTGLILALNLHADAPVWQCVIGSVFAIIVVKCLFGGLGCNFANPAAAARPGYVFITTLLSEYLTSVIESAIALLSFTLPILCLA